MRNLILVLLFSINTAISCAQKVYVPISPKHKEQDLPEIKITDPISSVKVQNKGVSLDSDIVFYNDPIEKRPFFPGGNANFYKYLRQNIHYPPDALKHKVQGKVFLSFIVEKNGRLTNLKVTRSVSKNLDAEALRVVQNSPKWVPGTHNGKPISYQLSLPINFSLSKK